MRTIVATLMTLAWAGSVLAQTASTNAANPKVRYIVGLDDIKADTSGKLTLQDGGLRFVTAKAETKVPISSIDDIFLGAETTQSGGKAGRVVKTAAIAAPFESGKALTILMRTKVDILTVAFHDTDGAVHGAIFALPKGQGEPMRTQLIQAGAHVSPVVKEVSQGGKP